MYELQFNFSLKNSDLWKKKDNKRTKADKVGSFHSLKV